MIQNGRKNVELKEFVVMPNHIHGILVLKGNKVDNNSFQPIGQTHT